MINGIWVFIILIGFMVALWNGRLEMVTQSAMNSAKTAVELCIGLIGIYSMWLGIMKVAEKAGLVNALSKRMRGLTRLLFPELSSKGAALGAITMNMVANMLGLGNAATPLGLKAMKELQDINRNKETASNAMCMFLVINASSIQLIPTTVIALRSSAGSKNPMEIIGTTLVATFCAAAVGILSAKILERFY